MGLLDDPSQLAAIVGLLQGRQPAGGLLMQYADSIEQRKRAAQQEQMQKLQQEHMQMQMAQQRQAQERDQGLRGLQSQFFQPGMPAQQQMGPTPDGSQMPMGLPTEPKSDQAGYAQAAMSKGWMTPMEAAQLQAKEQLVIPAGSTVATRGPGGTISPVFSAPDKAPPGYTRGPNGNLIPDAEWEASQIKLRQAGRPMTNINMPPIEKGEQTAKGALNIKNLASYQEAAQNAIKENSILSALERNPVDTSKAMPLTATAAAYIAPLGSARANEIAGNAQKFQAGAMELVLQKQLAQKGPQTESDAKRLEMTVASLGNTKEANAAIITFNKELNNRAIEQHRFYQNFWNKHKTLEGADQAWMDGPGSKSIWDSPALKKYGGGPQQSSDPEIDALMKKYGPKR